MKLIYALPLLSFLLTACGIEQTDLAKTYDNLAQAQAALHFENGKIR